MESYSLRLRFFIQLMVKCAACTTDSKFTQLQKRYRAAALPLYTYISSII